MNTHTLADLASSVRPPSRPDLKAEPIWSDVQYDPEVFNGVSRKQKVPCVLFGCEDKAQHRGLCHKHYQFWIRNGTEALNRRAKRMPRTLEEAKALLRVRAIEYADAEFGTPEFAAAERALDEAASYLDPENRRKLKKRTDAARQARRRLSLAVQGKGQKGPWRDRADLTFRERYIAEHGIEGWREYRRQVDEAVKTKFIAEHGEAAWKAKRAKASREYQQRKRAAAKAAQEAACTTTTA